MLVKPGSLRTDGIRLKADEKTEEGMRVLNIYMKLVWEGRGGEGGRGEGEGGGGEGGGEGGGGKQRRRGGRGEREEEKEGEEEEGSILC